MGSCYYLHSPGDYVRTIEDIQLTARTFDGKEDSLILPKDSLVKIIQSRTEHELMFYKVKVLEFQLDKNIRDCAEDAEFNDCDFKEDASVKPLKVIYFEGNTVIQRLEEGK